MSENRISKKHHYLPQYYLKGFTNSDNLFYVYDKQTDSIFPNPISPQSFFFINNLNTVTFPNGGRSDFIEDIYAEIESRTWNSFDSIRNSNPNEPVKYLDKLHLFLFMLFLHWRLPSNFQYIENLCGSLFSKDSKFPYFKISDKNGNEISDASLDEIRTSQSIKKTTRLIAAFSPFFEGDVSKLLMRWRFIYTGDNQSWCMVGDNPIISKGISDHDPKECLKEFIFPVSGNVILVASDRVVSTLHSPEFLIQFNTSIIDRASRFVACHRIDFLEAIVTDFRLHRDTGNLNTVIDRLFEILD